MARMGRPPVEINWEEFEKLCEIQCSAEEVACWFRCSVDAIERAVRRQYDMTFAEAKAQKGARGKVGIRRKLFQMAMAGNGNLGALIWLSKNYLGMSEKVESRVSGPDGGPQVIITMPSNGREVRPELEAPKEPIPDQE